MNNSYVKDDEWGTKYPHFQKDEFICPCCGSIGVGIATSLVELLEKLREEYGSVIITSGYRCPNYNAEVGGIPNSAHLKGQAADFIFGSGINNNQNERIKIVEEIKTMPNYHYAYCNIDGNYPNMGNAIHVDTYLTGQTTGEEYIVSADGDGLWLLDENGNRKQVYNDGTIVEYLGEKKSMYGYEYMKVKVIEDGNVGYMAEQYLVKKEEPKPEPTPTPTPDKPYKTFLVKVYEVDEDGK